MLSRLLGKRCLNSTSFGFEKVANAAKKQEKVNEVFDKCAKYYDKMNDCMSFGMHRLWKNSFVNYIEPNAEFKYLDIAGGTGDIAFRILDGCYGNSTNNVANIDTNVTVFDLSQEMLDYGEYRARKMGIEKLVEFKKGDAAAKDGLPFEENSFDVCTIAFGLRNMPDTDVVMRNIYKVLKPGGKLHILEFSQVKSPLLKKLYDTYSFRVIPVMGSLVAADADSYKYLVESIRVFHTQEKLAGIMKEAGFADVGFVNILNGVVSVHTGVKAF